MTPWVSSYQGVLLQGAWTPLSHWIGMACWLIGGALLLQVLLVRSRDQLTDWL